MSENTPEKKPTPIIKNTLDQLQESSPHPEPRFLEKRRNVRLARALKAVDQHGTGVEIDDQAKAKDLTQEQREAVDRVAEAVDEITGTSDNPQR